MGQPILHPGLVSQDQLFVTAMVTAPSEVTVQIGSFLPTTFQANHVGLNHFAVPFNGQTGTVQLTIVRNGRSVASATGPPLPMIV